MVGGFVVPENTPISGDISVNVLQALRQAIRDNPHMRYLPIEEIPRQLVLGGYLHEEPSLLFVADALGTIEAEDQAFGPDVPLEEAQRHGVVSQRARDATGEQPIKR